MSTSYPYLAIARQQNEDYGLVLHFADLVESYFFEGTRQGRKNLPLGWFFSDKMVTVNIWQQRARDQLSSETKRLIICKVAGEAL